MFRTVPLSIVRNISLYTQQWYMSYSLLAGSGWKPVPSWSCSQTVSKPVWHIALALLCVQWKTADGGQRNCPKHVEFYSKNKLEKLVHLIGFVIRIYHDARSGESQIYKIPSPWKSNISKWVVEYKHYGMYNVVSKYWRFYCESLACIYAILYK